MDCQKVRSYQEDYLDDLLDESTRDLIRQHLEHCPECRDRILREQEFRKKLQSLPVRSPTPDFKERVFNRVYAYSGNRHKLASSNLMKAAAGILLIISLGLVLKGVLNIGRPNMPQAYVTLHKQSEIDLVFTAKKNLQDVTLRLETPAGVEVPGFEGQRELAWQTNLKKGKNVLELPVVASKTEGGTLTAKINHGEQSRQFNLLLKVRQNNDRSDADIGPPVFASWKS